MALLLHVVVAVAVPLAGSVHEAAAADPRTHIEEAGGSPSCPRRHDHNECVTCRLATTALLFTAACRHAELATAVRQPAPVTVISILPRLLQSSPPGSRAPPVA